MYRDETLEVRLITLESLQKRSMEMRSPNSRPRDTAGLRLAPEVLGTVGTAVGSGYVESREWTGGQQR